MRSVKKYEPGILVNQHGKRFVDEGEDSADKTYAKFGGIIALTQPADIAARSSEKSPGETPAISRGEKLYTIAGP